MSDAQKVMADVLRVHQYNGARMWDGKYTMRVEFCICGWNGEGEQVHEAHQAAEIDKALGGLTREEQWVPVEESGHRWQPRDEALAHAALDLYGARGPMHAVDLDSPVDHIEHEARWVSGWSEVQS